MAEASQETSQKVSLWPKVVLWLLVIAFGVFYLNEVYERGNEENAPRQADRPASAPTPPTASAPEKSPEPQVAAAAASAEDVDPPESAPQIEPDRTAPAVPVATPPEPQQPAASAKAEHQSVPQSITVPPPPAAIQPPLPVQDPLAERRARVFAEYKALLESVEAERRALWEQMNQMGGGTDWPYPYPPPLPVGPPGYGWPPR